MVRGTGMSNQVILVGKIVCGAGEAAYFTELDWVQRQCTDKLLFKPYPGTLNIEVDEGSLPVLRALVKKPGIQLLSPDPNFCNARSLRASLGNVCGAIILPDEGVKIHGHNIVELIAPVCLKETLGLENGDRVEVLVEQS